MMRLYTAIGTLKFQKNPKGKPMPVILNHNQEYGLSEHELILWSCLAFQILQIHELKAAYEYRLRNANAKEAMPFSHYLNRLILRGLIAEGEGLTGVDALYRLLGTLHILPVSNPFPVRLFTCIQLRLEGKIRTGDMSKLLKKMPYPPLEETVVKLAQTIPVTTAELVSYVDLNKDSASKSSRAMLEELYRNPETTYQTLAENAQIHHIQYPVLQAIGNLYLNKQISFQRF